MHKVINYLSALILLSCNNVNNSKTNDPLADRFKLIEGKLQKFAVKHNAKIATVWSKVERHDPDGSDSFLVRNIVWTEGRFGKAILFEQHNDFKGVDTTSWDFSNLAWLQDTQLTGKPIYINHLLTNVHFQKIEKSIDQLLSKSEQNLNAIKVEDLK